LLNTSELTDFLVTEAKMSIAGRSDNSGYGEGLVGLLVIDDSS